MSGGEGGLRRGGQRHDGGGDGPRDDRPPGVALDAAGNSDGTGTSSDNTVAYVTAGPSGLVSDDFNSAQLDTGIWTFVNPLGDASYSMSGSQVRLSVPSGQAHDVWTAGNQAPRIMQSVADTDFAVEVKFDSVVSQRYQVQGLIVEQDSGNFLRVDQHYDGSQTRLFVARFTNGAPTVQYNAVISPGAGSFYLRLAREGDHWIESYSYDGTTWSGAADFTWSLSVHSVGVFAGNAGLNPAFTGIVDYYHGESTPKPEDLVVLTSDSIDPSSGLAAYKIETGSATYYLEKRGGAISSMIDIEGA